MRMVVRLRGSAIDYNKLGKEQEGGISAL